jgi:glycosyltransferase involved in cell wall biosynthesis
MRVKLLEALAMGKAVVSTRIGCEGIDGLVDGEHLLIADSEAGFADRVVHLLCDGDLRSRLGAAGRRLVAAKYGWRQVYQSFEETYRNVLDKWTQTGGEAAGPV